MSEKPFFFPNGDYRLFGVLHEPDQGGNGRGLVMCHAFAEEKLWAHRVFVNFARELARRGYTVLRFDVMGHGDSEGRFEDSSIETRLADIRCAVKVMASRTGAVERIGLIGLRLGATLAAMAAEAQPELASLILWAPLVNGSQYTREILRINMASQMAVYKEVRHNSDSLIAKMKQGEAVSIDGYDLRWPLFEQLQSINLLAEEKTYAGNTLIVQVSRKTGTVDKKLAQLQSLYPRCNLRIAAEDPFWKEIRSYYARAGDLFHNTLEWLEHLENGS